MILQFVFNYNKYDTRLISIKKNTARLLFIITIWLLFSYPANIYAEETKKFPFRIVTADEAPWQYIKDNIKQGDSMVILEEVLKEINSDTAVSFFPWSRSYNIALKNKNVMIFSIGRSIAREKLFNWCCPLYKVKVKLFKLKKNNNIHIKNFEDIKEYRIAVQRDDIRYQFLQKKGFSKIVIVNSDKYVINNLINGRVQLITFIPSSLKLQMEQLGLDYNSVEPVWEFKEMETSLYFAFNKNSDTNIVENFVRGYDKVKDSKLFQDIYNKYDK